MSEPSIDRGTLRLNVVGRLRDGVGEEAAASQVNAIFEGFAAAHPDSNRNVRARVVPLNVRLLGNLYPLKVLHGNVSFRS